MFREKFEVYEVFFRSFPPDVIVKNKAMFLAPDKNLRKPTCFLISVPIDLVRHLGIKKAQ